MFVLFYLPTYNLLKRLGYSSVMLFSIALMQTVYLFWTSDQLKMMAFGGNNRAHTFFKQHGWTGGGKVEAKYTSRAVELYRQILQKEVAKSSTADNGLP